MTQNDWRIGLAVTPKMSDHELFRTVWIIRAANPENETVLLESTAEYGKSPATRIKEPVDDWMTA